MFYLATPPVIVETIVKGLGSARLADDKQRARIVVEKPFGHDLDAMTQQLEDEGVAKFSKAFERLTAALHEKRAASSQESKNHDLLCCDRHFVSGYRRCIAQDRLGSRYLDHRFWEIWFGLCRSW
jgi:hypothetical protein